MKGYSRCKEQMLCILHIHVYIYIYICTHIVGNDYRISCILDVVLACMYQRQRSSSHELNLLGTVLSNMY